VFKVLTVPWRFNGLGALTLFEVFVFPIRLIVLFLGGFSKKFVFVGWTLVTFVLSPIKFIFD
jgi:hypothetical protein